MLKMPVRHHKKIVWAALVVAGSFFVFQAAGAALSVVRGKAWWNDQLQYVYFNCLDDIVGDQLDFPMNLCGNQDFSNPACAPEPENRFHFYAVGCSWLVHGVYIDEEGKFSGSAWNYAKGLISFEATTTPDADSPPDNYAFNVNCPNTCDAGNGCWACYNEANQKVYGWGRSTVDGTWLRLDSAATPPVQIKSWNIATPTVPYYALQAGDFVGTATSVDGNLSFNCQSENGGASNCSTRNYKTYIGNLQIGSLSAPNWSYSDACDAGPDGALKVVLRWYAKSGVQPFAEYGNLGQSAYRVIINTSNSTSSPAYDSGKVAGPSGTAVQLTCPSAACSFTPSYNTHYFWWIQLWDQADQPTEWYQYEHNSASDTGGDPDTNPLTFTTYKHEFPSPFFIWEPYDVSEQVGTTTEFMSYSLATTSQYYTIADPSSPQSCATPACQYLWTVEDNPDSIISATTSASTSIIFAHATRTTVTLRITDTDGYFCIRPEELLVNYGLPIWREVKAQ